MKKLGLFVFLCTCSISSYANTFIQNTGSITYLATGQGDFPADESFFIKVSTSLGSCVAGGYIQIRKQDFGTNVTGYQAVYSMALAAFMSNATNVSVYNGVGNDCGKATWIGVTK